MNNLGDSLEAISADGLLRSLPSVARMTKQVVMEGRLGEIAVDLAREPFSSRLHHVVEPKDPSYEWNGEYLVRTRPSRVQLVPLDSQLNGVCHAHTDGRHVWGWSGPRLVELDVETGIAQVVHQFPSDILTMHSVGSDTFLVALWGSLYLSSDGGDHFSEVLRLSHGWSKVIPRTLAEDGLGHLIVGEYGNHRDEDGRWQSTAWIHRSDDNGRTWRSSDFLIRAGVNKHIHAVAACPWTNRVFITTGDNYKWLLAHDGNEGTMGEHDHLRSWSLAGREPWRLGGYTAVQFTAEATYWGTDYWMGTNFVVAEPRGQRSKRWMLASPFRRNPIQGMAVVGGPDGNNLLVASANKRRGTGASALMALDESKRQWQTLFVNRRGEAGGVVIAQCFAESDSPWAHLRLKRRSFMAKSAD